MSSNKVKFSVNDKVVYPPHGVGEIEQFCEQVIGTFSLKVLVIKFDKDNMTVRVPVDKAEMVGLRHLSSLEDFEQSIEILKGKPNQKKGMWNKRADEYDTKINSGNPNKIAEVIRDLSKNVYDPERSYSERVIYETALYRYVAEYAAILKKPYPEVLEIIMKLINVSEPV